jgi:hypothetical protein
VVRWTALLVFVVALTTGCYLRRAGPPPSPHCRSGSPLVGVYHPDRLKLKSRCRVATGTVEKVKFEEYDGDVHLELRVDQSGLLARGNEQVGGTLIVEIIPWDRSRVPVPLEGQRVEVVGPWVDDMAHGWNEIHPAWFVSAGTVEPASQDELRKVDLLLKGIQPTAYDPDA